MAAISKKIGNPNFKDLALPFYVVATNLTKGQLRFHDGPVIPRPGQLRHSRNLEPVEIDGELYCDADIDRLPYEVLRKEGADLVIGVELSSRWKRSRPISSSNQPIF